MEKRSDSSLDSRRGVKKNDSGMDSKSKEDVVETRNHTRGNIGHYTWPRDKRIT